MHKLKQYLIPAALLLGMYLLGYSHGQHHNLNVHVEDPGTYLWVGPEWDDWDIVYLVPGENRVYTESGEVYEFKTYQDALDFRSELSARALKNRLQIN